MHLEIVKLDKGLVLYRISTDYITVELINLGATITDIKQFSNSYKSESIVMKLPKHVDYFDNYMYLGSTIGSYAGRIPNSTFSYANCIYQLPSNSPPHFLHGGAKGLHTKLFLGKVLEVSADKVTISFKSSLNEDDDSLPGSLSVEVVYEITLAAIKIIFNSSSTEVRLANITNHTYWNLSGNLRYQIGAMKIQCGVRGIWINDSSMIPAEKVDAKGVLDFSEGKLFKSVLSDRDNPLNTRENGLDNFFEVPSKKIVLSHKSSGRFVSITSSYSDCVIYTQNERLKKPLSYWPKGSRHLGVAVEFQYPAKDLGSDNPRSIIKPGEIKTEEMVFSFHTSYRRSVLKMLYGKNFK